MRIPTSQMLDVPVQCMWLRLRQLASGSRINLSQAIQWCLGPVP